MSARAIRALRGDNDALLAANPKTAEGHEEDDDDDLVPQRQQQLSSFAVMMDSEDDDDSDDSSTSAATGSKTEIDGDVGGGRSVPVTAPETARGGDREPKIEQIEASTSSEEDLDELIDEFRAQDDTTNKKKATQNGESSESMQSSFFEVVLSGLDPRDLDVDASMRNALVGRGDEEGKAPSVRPNRGLRQALLFGPPRDGWVKPPHYVGGGIGMSTYHQEPNQPQIPWPYNVTKNEDERTSGQPVDSSIDQKMWYFFKHSDNYIRDCEDYKVIQQSGDLNALVMFVVHHPYVTEALLQLTTVLYQTSHSQEGLAILRRCLWIYECSALLNFTRNLDGTVRMDVNQDVNGPLFESLFKLIQVSNIAGLPRTALATSRFLLSLDPLRDPMLVLPAMDYYALACNSDKLDRWLVQLVESERIEICFRDRDTETDFRCRLRDMPNWAYSYSLALFRIFRSTESEEVRARADDALDAALSSYPSVVGMLLQGLDVDTSGRSFRRDWVAVLDFATERAKQLLRGWSSTTNELNPILFSATMQACDALIKIFVQQNASLWGDDDVLQWMYDNLVRLKRTEGSSLPSVPSPALARYVKCNPVDYENRIQLLPQDVNLINPGMLGQVLQVNPNRPRFLRNLQRGGRAGLRLEEHLLDENGLRRPRQMILGGPPTQTLDPDWPVVEVLWRSFLPWNRVEGVPPPRR